MLTAILGLVQEYKVIPILTQAVEPKALVFFLLVAPYALNSADGCKEVALQHLSVMANSKCVGIKQQGTALASGRRKVVST